VIPLLDCESAFSDGRSLNVCSIDSHHNNCARRRWVAGVQCDPDADGSKPKFQQMLKDRHTSIA
jgi:hypothetical protein